MGRYLLECKNTQAKGGRQRLMLGGFYLVLFLVACGLACRPKTPAETDANTPQADNTTDAVVDGIAVTVNGVDITEREVRALAEPDLEKIAAKAAQLPPAYVEQTKKQIRQWALETLIRERLLDEKVKQAGIDVTEEEVMDWIKSMAASQDPPLSLEDFKKTIEKNGKSFDELRRQVRKNLGYDKLMEAELQGKTNITEADVKKYYSENEKQFEVPEQVRASHILIEPEMTDPDVDPNEAKAQAKAKAQKLLEQIRAGADFAELAKAHSADSGSAPNGGDLDFFARGEMEAPFDKVAFELKVGQVSDVVETRYGYHIIKVTDRKAASVTAFEQAKDDIMNALIQKNRAELARKYIESLKEKAKIVYPPGQKPRSAEPTLPGSPTGG